MKLISFGLLLSPFISVLAASSTGTTDIPTAENIITNVVFPDSNNPKSLPEFVNDQETNVQFQFKNNENTPIHIAGYFGSFYYNKKGLREKQPYANLTTAKIGPLAIEPGKSSTFDAKIMVNLPPEDFDLIISFFVGFQGEVIVVENKPLKVTISDAPVSFFNPKFLFVQLVFGLTIGGIGLAIYYLVLLPYIEDSNTSKKQTVLKKTVQEKKKSVNPGDKGYDESWIPSHHLKSSNSTANPSLKQKKSA